MGCVEERARAVRERRKTLMVAHGVPTKEGIMKTMRLNMSVLRLPQSSYCLAGICFSNSDMTFLACAVHATYLAAIKRQDKAWPSVTVLLVLESWSDGQISSDMLEDMSPNATLRMNTRKRMSCSAKWKTAGAI